MQYMLEGVLVVDLDRSLCEIREQAPRQHSAPEYLEKRRAGRRKSTSTILGTTQSLAQGNCGDNLFIESKSNLIIFSGRFNSKNF